MEILTKVEKKDKDKKNKKETDILKNNEKSESEITALRYVRDIGLIASTFSGTVKFFDAFNFHE